MNKWYKVVSVVFLLLLVTTLSHTQEVTPDFSDGRKWSAGLGFEYFESTISWDEDNLISPLKSYLMTFHIGYEIVKNLNLGGIFGYTSSDFESLTFRELPISLTIDKGAIGGFLFGGEADYTFYETDSLGFGVFGQYIYYLGGEKQWNIPGLAVEGTATGKPKWSRLTLGGSFKYTGTEPFVPFLTVAYNSLSGSFELEESIQSLNRREEKDISGVGKFMVGAGGIYDFSEAFKLHLEVDFTPYGSGDNYDGGVDFGALVRIMYSF